MVRNSGKRLINIKNTDYPTNMPEKGVVFSAEDYKAFYDLKWHWSGNEPGNLNLTKVCHALEYIVNYQPDYIIPDPTPSELEEFKVLGDEDENILEFEKAFLDGNHVKYFKVYDKILSFWWDVREEQDDLKVKVKRSYNEKTKTLKMNNDVLPGFVFMLLNIRSGSLVTKHRKTLMYDREDELEPIDRAFLTSFSKTLWMANEAFSWLLEDLDKLYYKAISVIHKRKKVFLQEYNTKVRILDDIKHLILEVEGNLGRDILNEMRMALGKVGKYMGTDFRLIIADDLLKTENDIVELKVAFVYHCLDAFYLRKYHNFEKSYMERSENAHIRTRFARAYDLIKVLYPITDDEAVLEKSAEVEEIKDNVIKIIKKLEKALKIPENVKELDSKELSRTEE